MVMLSGNNVEQHTTEAVELFTRMELQHTWVCTAIESNYLPKDFFIDNF